MGCSSGVQSNISDYQDDDIAAIVRGEEITIGDLRFLYPDEKVLENIEGAVKQELLLQEVKKMNGDYTYDIAIQKETMLMLLLSDEDDPIRKSMREFIESQAEKLGMTPDEYYKKYVEIMSEQSAYMNAYVQENFGEPDADDEDGLEIFNGKVNGFLSELVNEHKDEIEIFIK